MEHVDNINRVSAYRQASAQVSGPKGPRNLWQKVCIYDVSRVIYHFCEPSYYLFLKWCHAY